MQDKEKTDMSIQFELSALPYSGDLFIMIFGGILAGALITECVMSIVGMFIGNWDIVHLDPFVGIPFALTSLSAVLVLLSAVLVTRSRGLVDEDGIKILTAGFLCEIPWGLLKTVRTLEVNRLPKGFLESDMEHQMKYLIQLRGLPLPYALAGIFYGLSYGPLRLMPTFVVTPSFQGYELFLQQLTDRENDLQEH